MLRLKWVFDWKVEHKRLKSQEGYSVPTTIKAPQLLHFNFGGVPGQWAVSRIRVPVGRLSLSGIETWWQWRQVSRQPMESSITRQGEWIARGGRVICVQHMHFPVDHGGRQHHRKARYAVTLLESVIWHLLCVRVCQRAGGGFRGHRCFLLSPRLWVFNQRDGTCRARREDEPRGARRRRSASNGHWKDVIQPAEVSPLPPHR